MARIFSSFSLVLALLLTGCLADPAYEPEDVPYDDDVPPMISVETRAMLAFLNDPMTDRAMLDHVVGLERRAAEHLIAWREGDDRQPGTQDDRIYLSLEDVDSVPFVGPATITVLTDWAMTHGYADEMEPDFLNN